MSFKSNKELEVYSDNIHKIVNELKWLTLEEIMNENHFKKDDGEGMDALAKSPSSGMNNFMYMAIAAAAVSLVAYGMFRYRHSK